MTISSKSTRRSGGPARRAAVVALVGPPGAGKTTTLVKLAARYGLTSRKPAQILSADVFRIAAADQLRSLASILGIGCDVVETPAALAQVLEEHRSKDLVFIDTPGLAQGEMEDGADLARLIASHPEIDTHLVLPASMKPADMAGDRPVCDFPARRSSCSRASTKPSATARWSARPPGARCPFHSWRPASRFPTISSRRRKKGSAPWC